jgi:hypothetical protein
MPNNHFLCQGYLRGFATWGEESKLHLIEEMDSQGNVRTTDVSKVSCEKGDAEPLIEKLRSKENWWGKFRTNLRTDLHLDSNKGQRDNVAEFVADTIMLSELGRRVVRENTEDHFASKKAFEALKLGITMNKLKDNFLELNWSIAKPIFPLFTSDSPSCWRMDESDPYKIRAMFFPLTTDYLLCLSDSEHNVGFLGEDNVIAASTCGIAYITELIEGAAEQNTKLYAPIEMR